MVELTPEDRAMLDYSVKLTLTPHDVTEADVSALRSSGFDETAILDLCQVVSYYNYVNRLADGLGVELEKFLGGRRIDDDSRRIRLDAGREEVRIGTR